MDKVKEVKDSKDKEVKDKEVKDKEKDEKTKKKVKSEKKLSSSSEDTKKTLILDEKPSSPVNTSIDNESKDQEIDKDKDKDKSSKDMDKNKDRDRDRDRKDRDNKKDRNKDKKKKSIATDDPNANTQTSTIELLAGGGSTSRIEVLSSLSNPIIASSNNVASSPSSKLTVESPKLKKSASSSDNIVPKSPSTPSIKRTSSIDETSSIKTSDTKPKKGIKDDVESNKSRNDYGSIDKPKSKIAVIGQTIDSDVITRFRSNQRKEELKSANSNALNKKKAAYQLFCQHVKRFMRIMALLVIVTILTIGGISLKSKHSNGDNSNDDNSNIVTIQTDDQAVADNTPIYDDNKDDNIYEEDDGPDVFVITDDYEVVPEVVSPSEKPHIVFLLADDLGWNSIGYEEYDLTFATPYLSEYAAKGIIMDNYYAQEVCTPSRAALLTGRLPLTVGMQYSIVQPTASWGLPLEETTIADILQSEGYKTHMLGKWHLGHFSPRYLPTARGFDTFLGYLNGESYYWSKRNPDHTTFIDMMTSDSTCYRPYEDEDLHTYSTFLYRDKAIEIITKHDLSEPLFLYIGFQAVHDPFMDINHHSNGIPIEYLPDGMLAKIRSGVIGHKRRQYAMALTILDDAVGDIFTTLESTDMMDNTYVIFASDNGGCYLSGGKNGPLRGTKGSLFEGGVRVDAFIYSPVLIPEAWQGSRYSNMMHVADWLPTILNLTGITYVEKDGYEFDGVDHVGAWYGDGNMPRDHVLYNYFYNVDGEYFDKWTNGSFAIRDDQYKLMHTYDSTTYGKWFDYDSEIDNDDSLAEGFCSQDLASTGTFEKFLFDLVNDPYETYNIYVNSDTKYGAAKVKLYAIIEEYEAKAALMSSNFDSRSKHTLPAWKDHGNYVVPWVNEDDLIDYAGTYPADCYKTPTAKPSASPTTFSPTEKPTSLSVSAKPTRQPSGPTKEPTDETPSPSTASPTTPKPSSSPTTPKPTAKPTSIPTATITDDDDWDDDSKDNEDDDDDDDDDNNDDGDDDDKNNDDDDDDENNDDENNDDEDSDKDDDDWDDDDNNEDVNEDDGDDGDDWDD